jgi:F-type H+-transporting ATPase subunit gamma
MANLKQLRNRVRSIKSTQKITKAMQMVSASKLKKLKDKAENLNDYSEVLKDIMIAIAHGNNLMELPECDRKFFIPSPQLPILLVIMTSDKGLCGGFNSSVIKKAKADITDLQSKGLEFRLLIVGKKGYDAFKNRYPDLIDGYYNVSPTNSYCVAMQLRNKVISMVEESKISACYMYYNFFKNAMTQILTKEQVLPVDESKYQDSGLECGYEYEGDGLVHNIINLYIGGEISYGLLQSRASEEGARVTAMDNATRNAGDLINKLTLKLNRSRQAIITTELTEIISGAEAL